jgi:hypothetical protein
MKDGLDELRERYPEWDMSPLWVALASAPDYRKLRAERDGTVVEAYDATTLGARIREAEVREKSE